MPDARTTIDLAACEELMRGGSKSFFAASGLLPQRVRIPAIALYAFCRVADDRDKTLDCLAKFAVGGGGLACKAL